MASGRSIRRLVSSVARLIDDASDHTDQAASISTTVAVVGVSRSLGSAATEPPPFGRVTESANTGDAPGRWNIA